MTCLPAPGIHGSTPGLTRMISSDPRLYFLARSYSVSSYTVSYGLVGTDQRIVLADDGKNRRVRDP